MSSRRAFLLASLLLPLLGLGAVAWVVPRSFDDDLSTPFEHRRAAYVGSEACRSCHADNHRSWHRTFHRTMTQEASAASVLGRFDGVTLSYEGGSLRPVERGGRYFFEVLDPASGAVLETLPVLRTVGSRRYQQYLTQVAPGGGNYYRLPVLWHVGDARWVHLNGAFLGPDGQPFDHHVTIWNHNCIFCHNTGPEPGIVNYRELLERERRGEAVDSTREARYRSRVAELGIACESCHAPGGEHAERNRNPLRRYALHWSGRDDPTIVHPAKLDHRRAADVCGQCHGQRTPPSQEALATWISEGPSFRPGEDLAAHAVPVWQHTRPPRGVDPDLFRLRFWADGTPRLTAYEYQGLLLSPCFQRGELTCVSCHSMHEGDVRGQLTAEKRTAAACLPCHREVVATAVEHSGHRSGGPGGDCYACHMPEMVYGIMEVHRSHRIESPDPARDAAAGRPDACTSCHLDRSLAWAAAETRRLWGEQASRLPRSRGDGAPLEVVDTVASLHAGDPVQRAVAARLAGRDDSPLDAARRAFLLPHLLLALEDPYPAVRRFAHHSLRRLASELETAGLETGLEVGLEVGLENGAGLAGFDFQAPAAERRRVVEALWASFRASPRRGWPEPPEGALLDSRSLPLEPPVEALRRLARARSKQIDIGE